jgi:hypothetical protein
MSDVNDVPLRLPVQDFYSGKVRRVVAENAARQEADSLIRRDYANGRNLAELSEIFPHLTEREIASVLVDDGETHAEDKLQARIDQRIAVDLPDRP